MGLLAAGGAGLLTACSSGGLGLHGDATLRGRVVYRGVGAPGVRVVAGDGAHAVVSGDDGTFRLAHLPPGEARVAAGGSAEGPVAALATATLAPGAVTDLGDLVLTAAAVDQLLAQRGLGFEERVAVTPELSAFALADPTHAVALTPGLSSLSITLQDGSFGVGPTLQFTAADAGPGPGFDAAAPTLDLQGGFEVDNGFESYVSWQGDLATSVPFHLLPTLEGQPPDTLVSSAPAFQQRWLLVLPDTWKWATGPLHDDARLAYYAGRGHGPTIRPWVWLTGAASADLAGARPLTSVIAAGATNTAFVYVPYFGCQGAPVVTCPALVPPGPCPPNPACTAEEVADEAAGTARVMALGWPTQFLCDQPECQIQPERLLAKIPGARFPASAYTPAPVPALQLPPDQRPVPLGVAAGGGFYLLHTGAISRVDVASGAVTTALDGLDPGTAWQFAVSSDERALLLQPAGACPVELIALPGLSRKQLVPQQPGPCSVELLPGLVRVRAGALVVDFTEDGAPVDSRELPSAGAPLVSAAGGAEVTAGAAGVVVRAPGGPFQPLGPLGLQPLQNGPVNSPLLLTSDGRAVLFLARDPGSDRVQLFRLVLP